MHWVSIYSCFVDNYVLYVYMLIGGNNVSLLCTSFKINPLQFRLGNNGDRCPNQGNLCIRQSQRTITKHLLSLPVFHTVRFCLKILLTNLLQLLDYLSLM